MRLPAGPDLSPWSQAQAWIEDPIAFWRQSSEQFGEVFTVQLGSVGPTVLFSDPQAARQIFQLPTAAFESRHFNDHYKYLMGETSLLVSDGQQHQQRRRLLTAALQRPTDHEIATWTYDSARRVSDAWPKREALSVRASIHVLSLQVMLRIVFGSADNVVSCELLQLFESDIYHELGTWSPWTRFAHRHSTIRQLISEAIDGHRHQAADPAKSLLGSLVAAAAQTTPPLSDAVLQDQVLTLLVAGVDPVAIAITWALYWVLESPPAYARIRVELASLETCFDPLRVLRLPFLKAVCQEALRMYPVVATPSGRKLLHPVTIVDREFDAGVTLLPCTYLVHHREDLYSESDRFKPERFLQRDYASYEYFPFGGGTRYCIGAALAFIEMQVALATILGTWDLEAAHAGQVSARRHGTLLAPSDEMRLRVLGRADLLR